MNAWNLEGEQGERLLFFDNFLSKHEMPRWPMTVFANFILWSTQIPALYNVACANDFLPYLFPLELNQGMTERNPHMRQSHNVDVAEKAFRVPRCLVQKRLKEKKRKVQNWKNWNYYLCWRSIGTCTNRVQPPWGWHRQRSNCRTWNCEICRLKNIFSNLYRLIANGSFDLEALWIPPVSFFCLYTFVE